MNDDVLSIARFGLTALQNFAFAVLVGALLSDTWLRRKPSTWQSAVAKSLARLFRGAAIVAFAASVLYFWIHCAMMADTPLWEAWPAVQSMLRATDFGHAWAVTAVMLGTVIVLAFLAWEPAHNTTRIALWIAIAGAALARSHGGHPVDSGVLGLPVLVDWVHLLSISAWVGLVVVAACAVMPLLAAGAPVERLDGADYVQSLSDAATYALIALFLTGAYNGWHLVGAPRICLARTTGRYSF